MIRKQTKWLMGLLFLGGVLASIALSYGYTMFHQTLSLSEKKIFVIDPGQGLYSVLFELEQDGYIDDSGVSRLGYRLSGIPKIQIGTYALYPDETLSEVISRFEAGDVLTTQVQLIEGWNVWGMLKALSERPDIMSSSPPLTPKKVAQVLGIKEGWPEGYFLPETYQVPYGATDIEVLKIAHTEMKQLLHNLWQGRADDLPYESPYEALIMASIVERETGVANERPLIAGVFINRLRESWKLQTDPTIIYGLMRRGTYQGRITYAHLRDSTNPYSTYQIFGLPPTPIALPSAAALKAALNPDKTKAMFFVAKGDGSHKFSETLAEHNKAVRQYQLRRDKNYRSTPGQ